MLNATLRVKQNVNIADYHNLIEFLKRKSVGYKPKQAKVLTEDQQKEFPHRASNIDWLDVKVCEQMN